MQFSQEARGFIDRARTRIPGYRAIDERARDFVDCVLQRDPRCDYTIPQLPALANALATDTMPIFHNGNTYAVEVGGLPVVSGITSNVNLGPLGIYNVKFYGAVADGVTDDTSAIQAAVNAAVNAGGGIVYFPASVTPYFLLIGQITLGNNIILMGAGREATTLRAGFNPSGTAQTAMFLDLQPHTNVRIEGLTFDSNFLRAGHLDFSGGTLTNFIVKDCTFKNVLGAQRSCLLGYIVEASTYGQNVQILDCLFLNNNTQIECLLIGATQGVYVRSTFIGSGGTNAAALCLYGYVTNARIESAFINNTAIDFSVIQGTNITLTNCVFRNTATSYAVCVYIYNCSGVTIDRSCFFYFTSSSDNTIQLIDYTGPTFDGNPAVYQNSSNIDINGTFSGTPNAFICIPAVTIPSQANSAQTNVRIGGNFSGTPTAQCVVINANATGAAMSNFVFDGIMASCAAPQGIIAFYGLAGSGISNAVIRNSTLGVGTGMGVQINAASGITLEDNDLSQISYKIYISGTGAKFTAAKNNLGYNPVGAMTAPTVGTSPWTYTNNTGVDQVVNVSGGTVSAISANGVVTGLTSGSFFVPIGETLVVTYSAAPTVTASGN